MIEMSEVVKRLISARKRAGLSQGQVAQLLGLSGPSSFAPFEKGTYPITLERFLKLCELYAVSPIWALTGVNPNVDSQQLIEHAARVKTAAQDLDKLLDWLEATL